MKNNLSGCGEEIEPDRTGSGVGVRRRSLKPEFLALEDRKCCR